MAFFVSRLGWFGLAKKMAAKSLRQVGKDYVLFPALSGPLAPLTFAGNATANLIRNLWGANVVSLA
jgi:hypothetical protein